MAGPQKIEAILYPAKSLYNYLVNKTIICEVLKFYNVNPVKIYDEEHGYRNKSYHVRTSQDDLNLIIYKNEPGILERIKRADALSEIAHRQGLPTRRLYSDEILCLKSKTKTTYARLYYYLPGETIAWEMYTMKHIKLLGQAMSDLHFVTKDSQTQLPKATDELLDQLNYICEYFTDEKITSAIQKKLNIKIDHSIFKRFEKTILTAGELESQPLHLDLVRGNVLFDKSSVDSLWKLGDLAVSGLIDFEKCARGNVTFDLARTYAFLLTDCSRKTPEKIYKYLIHSGYNKYGKSRTTLNKCLFDELVSYYLFYDFYKFLEHNPYEFLNQNHHYEQTKSKLITRKIVQLL
jgi:Putative homoserine kinase type II (protein kinase fold)